MKPIIGVTPLYDDSLDSIWMLPGYLEAIRLNNAIAITFPLKASEQDILTLCDMCDGFLFTGGHDVCPTLYNKPISKECGLYNNYRDFIEKTIFDYATTHNKPILGICRGIQIINVLCGGSLYQDIASEYNTNINHVMKPPYYKPQHNVSICDNTPFSILYNTKTLAVNSYHHQAIKTLGNNLIPMAISEDGLIEAVFMKDMKYIQAIQWHPEFAFDKDENYNKIFTDFINHCTIK